VPQLEHEFLKELRDFLLSGMRAFRRLLLGLHQDSGDVVDVFQLWRQWRTENAALFSSGDRNTYYAQGAFGTDFLRFVRMHYIPVASKAPLAIRTLMEYEAALLGGDRPSHEANIAHDNGRHLSDDMDEPLAPHSRPQLHPGIDVISLSADYQEIARRLRQRGPLFDIPDRPVTLAIRRTGAGPAEVRQLSPLSAELLTLCQGRLTVEEIAAEFLERKLEVPGIPANKVCLAGIEILRQQGLIRLA
jgi:hypothetical protein